MDFIRDKFDTLGVTITPEICHKMHALVVMWETHAAHPLTLNSQMLGTPTIVFTDHDRSAL